MWRSKKATQARRRLLDKPFVPPGQPLQSRLGANRSLASGARQGLKPLRADCLPTLNHLRRGVPTPPFNPKTYPTLLLTLAFSRQHLKDILPMQSASLSKAWIRISCCVSRLELNFNYASLPTVGLMLSCEPMTALFLGPSVCTSFMPSRSLYHFLFCILPLATKRCCFWIKI
jgi:hypothetical protein